MLLAAKLLEPCKASMTIEYLVGSLNGSALWLRDELIVFLWWCRDKNSSETYWPTAKSNRLKPKPFSVRRVHGPCIANGSLIRTKNPDAAGLRSNIKERSWTQSRRRTWGRSNCKRIPIRVTMATMTWIRKWNRNWKSNASFCHSTRSTTRISFSE